MERPIDRLLQASTVDPVNQSGRPDRPQKPNHASTHPSSHPTPHRQVIKTVIQAQQSSSAGEDKKKSSKGGKPGTQGGEGSSGGSSSSSECACGQACVCFGWMTCSHHLLIAESTKHFHTCVHPSI